MTGDWRISDRLEAFLKDKLSEVGGFDDGESCPTILWALGGSIDRGEGPTERMPPHYALGWTKKADLGRFVAVPSMVFGHVAFSPSEIDRNSERRLIDGDGWHVFVV